MEISVVIPVYGCREALSKLYDRLTKSLCSITDSYEIILVNDKCPQNSWEDIEKLCDKDKHVIGIELAVNTGQNRAIMAGLDESNGDWVVVMDCDLQDQPEDIPLLYNKAMEGYDIVFARRTDRNDNPFKVFVSKCFYNTYSLISGDKYNPELGNFSIVSRRVIECYCSMREYHRDYSTYINGLGFYKTSIRGHHDKRESGKSSYTLMKKLRLAGEILTSKPDLFLGLMTGFGGLIFIASVIGCTIRLIRHIVSPVTWSVIDILLIMCFFCGIIITQVALVGIYVGKNFTQSKNRPLYFVRQIKNKSEDMGE